jgi:hypothetical protein
LKPPSGFVPPSNQRPCVAWTGAPPPLASSLPALSYRWRALSITTTGHARPSLKNTLSRPLCLTHIPPMLFPLLPPLFLCLSPFLSPFLSPLFRPFRSLSLNRPPRRSGTLYPVPRAGNASMLKPSSLSTAKAFFPSLPFIRGCWSWPAPSRNPPPGGGVPSYRDGSRISRRRQGVRTGSSWTQVPCAQALTLFGAPRIGGEDPGGQRGGSSPVDLSGSDRPSPAVGNLH